MAKEPSMAFYRSFYELASLLPERGRQRVLTAMLDLFFEGTEPSLGQNEERAFNAVRGRIEAARTGALSAAKRWGGDDPAVPNDMAPTMPPTDGGHTWEPPEQSGDDPAVPNDMAPTMQSESESKKKSRRKRNTFVRDSPPTLDEVRAYASEASLNLDCERFIDFYEGNGWMCGRNPMKDWKATARRASKDWCQPKIKEGQVRDGAKSRYSDL